MAVIELQKIKTAEELERVARRDLEGKTLLQIAKSIGDSDYVARAQSKGGVGYVIEEGYFGIKKNSSAGPDIPHLGVEVKTSPLKFLKNGKLQIKEPLSLNIINYNEEYKNKEIKNSSLYKKNKKILFVWYVHDDGLRSGYIIKYVFLWEMTSAVIAGLEPDYQAILEMIRKGEAHHIHQYQHKNLTLCPKHSGKFKDPEDRKSKTTQPFSKAPAEIRAFRLKNSYTGGVIRRYLDTRGADALDEFVKEKTALPVVKKAAKKLTSPATPSRDEINVRGL